MKVGFAPWLAAWASASSGLAAMIVVAATPAAAAMVKAWRRVRPVSRFSVMDVSVDACLS